MKKKRDSSTHYEKSILHDMEHVVSSNDMTGLMATPPENKDEQSNYNELLSYTPKKAK